MLLKLYNSGYVYVHVAVFYTLRSVLGASSVLYQVTKYKQESRTLFCEGCNLGIIIAIMRRFIHRLRMARGSVGFFRRILYQRIRHDALDAIVSLCLAVYAERYFMLVLLPRPVWATFTGFTQLSCGACVIACSL